MAIPQVQKPMQSLVPHTRSARTRYDFWQKSIVVCTHTLHIGMYALTAHILGLPTFGLFLFVHWLASFSAILVGTGMSPWMSLQIARIQSQASPRLAAGIFYFLWHRQNRYFLFHACVYLLLAIPLSTLFPICRPILLLLAGLAVIPQQLSIVVGTTLRSMGRNDLLPLLDLLGILLSLLLILLASQFVHIPIETFLLTLALTNTFTLIIAILCITKLLPLHKARHPGIFLKERLLDNLHQPWSHIILDAIIWQPLELLLLAYWYGSTELCIYAISTCIITYMLRFVPYIFTSWIHPLCQMLFPHHRYWDRYATFVYTSCHMVFIAVPLALIIMVYSPTLITFILGRSFLPVVTPLRIQLLAAVLGSIATSSITYLAQQQRQNLLTPLNCVAALLKLLLAFPLISNWGPTGAAIATTAAQSISAIGTIFICQRFLKQVTNA